MEGRREKRREGGRGDGANTELMKKKSEGDKHLPLTEGLCAALQSFSTRNEGNCRAHVKDSDIINVGNIPNLIKRQCDPRLPTGKERGPELNPCICDCIGKGTHALQIMGLFSSGSLFHDQ